MENNAIVSIKAGVAGILAVLTGLWGWFGWLVVAWVCLMLSDWLVGSAAAMKAGKWSSTKLREGAWHKGGMVIIVCVALVADWLIGSLLFHIPGVTLPFDYTVLLGPMMIVWYILGELGSLAEHAVAMGAKIPGWLPRILAISKEAVDAAGDAITHDSHHDAKGKDHEAH